MPKNTPQRRIDSRRQNRATNISGITLTGSPGSGGSAALAGDGLAYDGVALNVGAGTLITVGSDDVGITAGSNYQYIGTGAGTVAAWQNLSALAGAGLTHAAGVLAVGAGNGITVNADDVALTTPGTLTAATSNSSASNHTHAITTGAASTLTVSTSNATGSSASLARADHLHTITSSADVTAGGTALLASSSGNLKLATGNIGSTLGYNGTFTSGFAGAGWRVDYGVTEAAKASATFDNLTVRGRMRVYELLIQQIRATNGSVFVSSSSKVFTVTNTTNPTWTVNGATLTLNGDDATLTFTWCQITTSDSSEVGADRTHYHGFLNGDVIRAQQVEWDGSGFGGIIQSDLEVTSVTNLYSYGASLVSGDVPVVGYDYVRLGSKTDTTRQGAIYLTSDDDNSPFIDIVDGITRHSDWNTEGKIRARLGRLDGITDAEWGTLDGYGLWSDNVYLTGNIYATDGIFSGAIYAQSGSIDGFLTLGTSGGIYQGTGTAGTPTTGLKIWNDSGVGRIGGYNSGNLQWYASTTGYFYSGAGTMRIGNDDMRLKLGTYVSDVATDYRYIKWLPDVDTTDSGLTSSDYRSYITTYASTVSSQDRVSMDLSVRVNAGDYDTRQAWLYLKALNYNGSALHYAQIVIVQEDSGESYNNYIEMYSNYLKLPRSAGTSNTPASGYCYVWVDSGSNTLKMRDSAGTTRSVTFS